MATPIITETHTKTIHVRLTWDELKFALLREAMASSEIKSLGPKDKAVIEIRQLTEGSPAYSVSKWEATVEITQDISDG